MSSPAATLMSIPFFRYSHLFEQQRDEVLKVMTEVMERGAFILQSDLVEFEAALAAFTGAKHALGVANGTDAAVQELESGTLFATSPSARENGRSRTSGPAISGRDWGGRGRILNLCLSASTS